MKMRKCLPLLTALLVAPVSTAVMASTISYFIDQSNALPDGEHYAQVTISDSTTSIGDIDFSVALLSSAFDVSGTNFGMQTFSFNYDSALHVTEDNITDISVAGWSVEDNRNAGGGFGKFDFQLSGNGSTRTSLLTFTISGVGGDNAGSYAIESGLNHHHDEGEFFATHIAGFDETDGVTSAQFAGSVPAVPAPFHRCEWGSDWCTAPAHLR